MIKSIMLAAAALLVTSVSKAQFTPGGYPNTYYTYNWIAINTDLPHAQLEVNGAIIYGGAAANLYGQNFSLLANSGKTLLGWNRTGGAGETDFVSNQGSGSGGGFAFYNYDNNQSESQLMYIHGNGNVQIGTNANAGNLDVNGYVHTREVRVDTQNFPDFVFKPSYRLRPLSEVQTFINRYHHLPDMPSEANVIHEGMNLGEMNKKLLQKVEELTLYLIEKDKELKQLRASYENRLNALEKSLNKIKN